jgi:hypothetical protein
VARLGRALEFHCGRRPVEAGGEIAPPQAAAEGARHRPQHLVAGGVAACVVHLLEVVEIDQEQREAAAVAIGGRKLALELLAEPAAVGDTGQIVGGGEIGEPLVRAGVVDRERRQVGELTSDLRLVGREAPLARSVEAEDADQRPLEQDRHAEDGLGRVVRPRNLARARIVPGVA